MSTKADTPEHPLAKRGSNNPLAIFITALSAAICLAISFGLVFEAFAVAAGGLFDFGETYLWVTGVVIGAITLWLFVWCLVRALHVERRLRAGLDVDQPTFAIFGNSGRGTPATSQE
ncbi:hypothetical protein [Methyloligella solikamskensis]|uniref:Uncharacterized protein n=1 Tax=Methyloligella solikamskensis TaxID=1177756 RepID=A0ABW3JBC3_9HYPH